MFRCAEGCRAGVLLRGSTRPAGTASGMLYGFAGELGAFRVAFEASGKESHREKLAPSPSPYPASMMTFRGEFPGLGNFMAGSMGRSVPPPALLASGEWNHVEVYLAGNSVRGLLNGRAIPEAHAAGVAPGDYGAVGLFASGAEVRLKDVGVKGLDEKAIQPTEVTSPGFEKRQLEALFYSEAITAADVNRDGHLDVIAGPFIHMGPDFITRRELFIPRAYEKQAYPDPLLASAGDYTGDGYPDVLYTGEPGRPGFLYVNPGDTIRRWDKYPVIASVDNEVAFMDDLDGDGKEEYVYGDGGLVGYAAPGPDPTTPWVFHPVTEKGPWGAMYAHGLGTGDINGDGRKDIVQAYGWWEQPAAKSDAPWPYHPYALGKWGPQQGGAGGARAYVYDVNGDGRNDIITSIEAHGWGLAWFEQTRDASGRIAFTEHRIMGDATQPNNGIAVAALHALTLGDVDGDGLLDVITGKRWWGHFGENPTDPDAWGDPVVAWFRLVREGGGRARYVGEVINNNSGVGTDMISVDLNKDGRADVLTSTRRGTNIFLSRR
jgi:hypothetical protein